MAVVRSRFYEQKFPDVDDVVMVNVRSIAEMGAYVTLSEYNDIEGMILLSELSRRRIRSIQKLVRVGRSECVVVLRVDKEKGYIDLSKRRVSREEIAKCEEKFNKGKAVNSILRHVAATQKCDVEMLYKETAWKLDKLFGGPSKSYDAFKLAITEKPEIWDNVNLDEDLKKALIEQVKRRLTPQPVKIRSDIEVACYAYEGINAVKEALRAGLALSPDVKISLIAPPQYVVTTTSLDKDKGIELLTQALASIKKVIEEKRGSMNVIFDPRAVTEQDDKELAAMMEKFDKENQEVSGDDEQEAEDIVGMGGPDGGDDEGAAAAPVGDGVDEVAE
mmetsp:Transcript_553/g.1790  ORF Transcript_553/g.1790 Transcript_553/m.1790 type:complete len:333 (+) Transcript_553:76-1074(+)|eukprot:CAMPEP_0182925062 /NCGR_PEP_ID=MMETSP0105_2-20130417/8107_1 /TAXON_ID=81532 ORGANISM="Acanthoeca-like sp., Strain 10tr" /NCGR_SAMPLE_ID=MMETSP0105_2 /ASSEMBLY_ACC=CAM_ASM_000205 /LENGTH=332 /DNA_ID=CAMNT_0025062895 /DNA_START=91 /DNA_END=1089 /DNA_ORIENTATION=-